MSATLAERPPSKPEQLAGRALRMMRQTHRVSLRGLAALADVSPAHLSRVETGKRGASPDVMQRLYATIASLPA